MDWAWLALNAVSCVVFFAFGFRIGVREVELERGDEP